MHAENISLDLIDDPENAHRIDIDASDLQELAESIREHGVLQPIIVRPTGERYEIIAGHRRTLASRIAGKLTIPAMLAENILDTVAEQWKAIENLQRAQLSPFEEARIVGQLAYDHGMEIDVIASKLSRTVDWVKTRIDLAALPDDLFDDLHTKKLPISHALQLARITDDTHRAYLHEYARRDGVNLNILRAWCDEWVYARDNNLPLAQALPEQPPAGDIADISLPCGLCNSYTAYRQMALVRLCPHCANIMAGGIQAVCAACAALTED